MTRLIRPLLPTGVAAAEVYSDPPGLVPLPEEEPLIAKSVPKRRNEFIAVRHCARIALAELGLPATAILKGDKGQPLWPHGGVGIDAEPHEVLPRGVLDAISLPIERHQLGGLPKTLHWDRILFCAKEATYKTWFPLTHRWLGFEDAHITFAVDPSGTAGTFSSKILIDPAAESGPPLTVLDGRWSVTDGLALTAITL